MQSTVSVEIIVSEFIHIGVVSRVDFVPIGKQHGFVENINADFKAAYVHFSSLTTRGQSIQKYITDNDFGFTFYTKYNDTAFWVLLVGKNPVQDTMMNAAQIVDNCRFLERKVEMQQEKLEQQQEKLEQQQEKLEQQSATIKDLQKKVDGVRDVVYQLIGGLFSQTNQSQMVDIHLASLFPENNNKLTDNQ
jgi:hypothetical protein